MKEQQNQFKDSIINVKNYFVTMPKKRKILVGAIATAAILAAVVLTLVLNSKEPAYSVLYSGMESSETLQVYNELAGMGVSAQLNGSGEISVPTEQVDFLLLSLAAKGYPKSTLTYSIADSRSGLTTTESQNKQYTLYQIQDRMQDTLKKLEGVQGATVTISLPEKSTYAWELVNNNEQASASVLLDLGPGVSLSSDQVTAIKNLVAFSVEGLEPSAVVVVDSGTSQELFGTESDGEQSFSSNKNLELTDMVQMRIEKKIEKLLAPTYGSEGVVAVANVTLDFDAMMTEKLQHSSTTDADGNPIDKGYPTHVTQGGTVNGEVSLGTGIVGEEDNTDIPGYVNGDPTANGGGTSFQRAVDIDYDYIKQQITKGNFTLSKATISVMVNENNMTEVLRQTLIDLISKAADIPIEQISVGTFVPDVVVPVPQPTVPPEPNQGSIPIWVWFIVGGVLLLLLILIFVILRIRKRSKKIVQEKDAELEDNLQTMEDEIAKYKRELENAARSATDPKDDAILDEVRGFAKENPEITANLLRSWLKEGDE